jgi:hypothetical protein
VSHGCRPLEESGSLYLVDLIAIIEVRGEEVLASTLAGDRMWRRGPGVPGGSELCLRVWFRTYMEMISIYALGESIPYPHTCIRREGEGGERGRGERMRPEERRPPRWSRLRGGARPAEAEHTYDPILP